MKRIAVALVALMLCVGCQHAGQTAGAEVRYGSSTRFSQAEVKSAVDTVLVKFRDFKGCDLKAIWYDESASDLEVDSYLAHGGGSYNGVARGDVIVLLSDFHVAPSGADPSFNPGMTYTGWNWILIRDSPQGPWRVDDCGY